MSISPAVKVIYIVGLGRSGSTVLDTVLGNHIDVESVGELGNAFRSWGCAFEYCACGEVAGKCKFWNEVRDNWEATRPRITTAHDWSALQSSFERPRHIPRLYLEKFLKSKAFEEYTEGTKALYFAIAKVSGKKVIVDSSKSPARAFALSYIKDIDLRLVHLIRDGRGVAWSLMRSYSKNPEKGVQQDLHPKSLAKTAIAWRLINYFSELARRRLFSEHTTRLRYEDFVSSPDNALERIGNVTKLDFSTVINSLAEGKEMTVSHTIAGNRVRMEGAIRLKADIDWQKKLTKPQKDRFWFIAGSKARQYGYSKDV